MKKLKQLFFFGFTLTFILSSCSIEKRQYMSGYYVSWHNNNHSGDMSVKSNTNNAEQTENKNKVEPIVTTEQTETSAIDNSQINDNTITASTDKSIFIPATPKIDLHKNKNKTVLIENTITSETKTIVKANNSKKNKKATKSSASAGGGKSQLVALLLCIFLGVLGIHRFYLGYTGLGIMYLLFFLLGIPLALVLIGYPILLALFIIVIVDLIRIIIGNLKPKGGEYADKL